jgi:hypothetical protein
VRPGADPLVGLVDDALDGERKPLEDVVAPVGGDRHEHRGVGVT